MKTKTKAAVEYLIYLISRIDDNVQNTIYKLKEDGDTLNLTERQILGEVMPYDPHTMNDNDARERAVSGLKDYPI